MPTYNYICQSCQDEFTVFHGMMESPEISCAKCGGQDIKKGISAGSGFILKGSGFYNTDYKKKQPEQTCASSGCGNSSCPAASS